MKKTFKVSQIRDLLNQVYNEKITFSKFVEVLNENANSGNELRPIIYYFQNSEKEIYRDWGGNTPKIGDKVRFFDYQFCSLNPEDALKDYTVTDLEHNPPYSTKVFIKKLEQ